ncbi:MAG: N-6 DNA methylase [Fimbriimonadaceae bacterium]|nr:N-6 DNA methylase [Fimbriimonadaceae bacterium]QOJ11229.1 MAG: N-6 DNA methylase [Chthonomonadaceae bacterium]
MRQDANVVNRIKEVQSFPSLLKFLRDDLDWPITSDDVEDLTFDYSPDELGFDKKMAVKVRSIKQLRPLVKDQPWGIFYIDFEPKRLPVGALRRLLRSLVVKKRGGGDGSQATWNLDDLLFISFHGEESRRTVAFAHFHERDQKQPQLRTFYWDQGETEFASVLESLGKLNWPQYAGSAEMAHVWRQYWGAAFRVGHGEVIRDSKALSKKLAQVALKIRQHVFDLLDAEDADKGPLHRLFASFKKALLHDLDEQRFADVLAQTFTYGLLAAKAEIGTKTPLEPGHLAEQIPATNPLLRELFEEFQHLTGVGLDKLDEDLGDLGVDELVDLLNTVDVDEALKNFGRTTMSGQEDPVVHFYEEFLKDYDKEQKVERGVFYTPKPVVSFIVRSVHEILQKEFGLEDGLASTATWDDMVAKHEGLAKPEGIRGNEPFVQILDPAVGTGTFLEACIQLVYDTMAAKWSRAGKDIKTEWNRYVPEHLLPRLHGFELMMAPYVVCHMKLALRLKELGYDFQSGERLRVYLTNALEPGLQAQSVITGLVAAIAHEAHAAAADKREKRFSAVIGNPPYSGHSANASKNKDGSYTFIGQLLQDYYQVDGHPLGEKNPKWLQDDYVKFIRLGQFHVQQATTGVLAFISNHGYLDNPTFRGMRQQLMGAFPEIRLLDLHGNSKKKETASDGSKDDNVFDIMQGVAIGAFVCPLGSRLNSEVTHGDLFGLRQAKYEALATSSLLESPVKQVHPSTPFYLFIAQNVDLRGEYERWWKLTDIFPVNVLGFQSHRDHFAIAFTADEMRSRMEVFRSDRGNDEVAELFELKDNRDWKVSRARQQARLDPDWDSKIINCAYRPFDTRACYFSTVAMDYPRRELLDHVAWRENWCLNVTRQTKSDSWQHNVVTHSPAPAVFVELKDGSSVMPLWLYPATDSLGMDLERRANLSNQFLVALRQGAEADLEPESVFGYIYCVLSSPTYRARYVEFLKIDFARVPLPGSRELFNALALRGLSLIDLHLLGGERVEAAPRRYQGRCGIPLAKATYELGGVAVDDSKRNRFESVPEELWEFTVGGYQPAQKWLKDRKGRTLTEADIRHYEHMLYAIEETIRIMAEIDEVIEAHGGWPGAFQHSNDEVAS